MLKILCVGQEWRGSDASGLFYAFSSNGCAISVINDRTYISGTASSVVGKAIQRLVRPVQMREFNSYLLRVAVAFKPHLIFVFKGQFVERGTVMAWKKLGVPVVNYFPDVSMLAHGKHIPQCIPHYDFIFTTKTFGVTDLAGKFNYPIERIHFIPHGFDPQVHRKIDDGDRSFACEASFIGTYSQHKERYLAALSAAIPDLNLKVWGGNWYQSTRSELESRIQGIGVHGDLFALAINQSAINIALLSEKVKGASLGDQITSRTFQIPGAGGFMLHQRTEEVLEYFEEDEEIVCFETEEDLIDKVTYYRKNDLERRKIAENGYLRAQKNHSQVSRAAEIIKVLRQQNILRS